MGFLSRIYTFLFTTKLDLGVEPAAIASEAHTEKASIKVPTLTMAQLAFPVEYVLGEERNGMNFLATCQGDVGAFIVDDISRLIEVVDNDFEKDSKFIKIASSFFIGQVEVLVKHLGMAADRGSELHHIFKNWSEDGLNYYCAQDNLEVGDYLLEKILARRESDRETILLTMQQKWLFLKPLLTRAMREGIDHYGEQNYRPLLAVCLEFSERFLPDSDLLYYKEDAVVRYVFKTALSLLENESVSNRDIPIDGIEFEQWCANQVSLQGWTTRVTQASNDQGVDVIATKDGVSVAIQCKRYAGSVGNKAVQEIYTGKTHFDCTHASVISTGLFTPAAKQLAKSTGVVLIDANDIEMFDSHFSKN